MQSPSSKVCQSVKSSVLLCTGNQKTFSNESAEHSRQRSLVPQDAIFSRTAQILVLAPVHRFDIEIHDLVLGARAWCVANDDMLR